MIKEDVGLRLAMVRTGHENGGPNVTGMNVKKIKFPEELNKIGSCMPDLVSCVSSIS